MLVKFGNKLYLFRGPLINPVSRKELRADTIYTKTGMPRGRRNMLVEFGMHRTSKYKQLAYTLVWVM